MSEFIRCNCCRKRINQSYFKLKLYKNLQVKPAKVLNFCSFSCVFADIYLEHLKENDIFKIIRVDNK